MNRKRILHEIKKIIDIKFEVNEERLPGHSSIDHFFFLLVVHFPN